MKYRKQQNGDWVKPLMRGYRMMCCDCGLVHVLNFRVIRWGCGHKVLFQVFRHNRATAAARRKASNGSHQPNGVPMPEARIKARGGAVRYRTIKKGKKTLTCAVTRRKGPHGGRTVCWKS